MNKYEDIVIYCYIVVPRDDMSDACVSLYRLHDVVSSCLSTTDILQLIIIIVIYIILLFSSGNYNSHRLHFTHAAVSRLISCTLTNVFTHVFHFAEFH